VKILSKTHIFNFLLKLHLDNTLDIGTSYSDYIHYFCSKFNFICKIIINSIANSRITNRVNFNNITDLYYYEPGGTSTKNLIHWIQIYEKKRLEFFDYGPKNMEIYGKINPPQYKLENYRNWNIKSFLTLSNADDFSSKKDLNFFLEKIEKKEGIIKIKKVENYNHLDYLWSEDAKYDIYSDILDFLNDTKEEDRMSQSFENAN
jgi:hypothetical protein